MLFPEMDKLKQKINLARDHLQHIFTEKDTALEKIKNFNSKIGTNHTRIAAIEMKLEELRAKIQRAKEAADGVSAQFLFAFFEILILHVIYRLKYP